MKNSVKLVEKALKQSLNCRVFRQARGLQVPGEKSYRCAALDESIRAKRTRNEAKVMREAQSNGVNTPLMLGVDEVGKKFTSR